jgi:hypothetical protein
MAMTTTETVIQPIEVPDFSAYVVRSGDGLKMNLTGNADLNVTATLDRFVDEIHREACRIGVREVVVDLRELEFMNSSCLKSFVWWIGCIQKLEPASQYKIRFLAVTSRYWQRRSLGALAGLAMDLVVIEL